MINIHENELFRFHECGLSVSEAAHLCCVSVAQVESWDRGKRIPPVCKRLMSLYSGKDLSLPGWYGWILQPHKLISPFGDYITPRQLQEWASLHSPVRNRFKNPVREKLYRIRNGLR